MIASTVLNDPRDVLLNMLRSFVESRPGFDPRNYISGWNDTAGRAAYRSDSRSATNDLHHARELLRFVELHDSIGFERIKAELRNRLTLDDTKPGRMELSYCAGQYYPTEFRAAACRALASVIWSWLRDECNCETGDAIRKAARRNFSRAVARRWFN